MNQDLSQWFEEDLLPAVFDRLPSAFPEFGWVKDGANGWKATKDAGLGCRPDRVVCHLPFGFKVHGEDGGRTWLAYVNGGTFPRAGSGEWIKAAQLLAQRVGMGLPEKDLSPDARARQETR